MLVNVLAVLEDAATAPADDAEPEPDPDPAEVGVEEEEEVAADPDPDPDPDPAAAGPPIPDTAAQVPVNEVPLVVSLFVTSGPGSGKTTSLPSMVVQPLSRFATHSVGRSEKATLEAERVLLLAPVTVTLAQSM